VKHSVVELEPHGAAEICGVGIEKIRRFAANIGEQGVLLGLIGPDEPARLWTRHILNCALLAPFIPVQGKTGGVTRAADVGSGAGFPGLVLAMIRPDVEITLIEPLERRTKWLREQVEALGLTNVHVFTGRAQEFKPKKSFDLVTARAVKALKTLVPIVRPLLVSGGTIALLKGSKIEAELTEARTVLELEGVYEVDTPTLGLGTVEEPTRLFLAKVK
jgi:16S rRNA (guanine527-N7)-methyltransferase